MLQESAGHLLAGDVHKLNSKLKLRKRAWLVPTLIVFYAAMRLLPFQDSTHLFFDCAFERQGWLPYF